MSPAESMTTPLPMRCEPKMPAVNASSGTSARSLITERLMLLKLGSVMGASAFRKQIQYCNSRSRSRCREGETIAKITLQKIAQHKTSKWGKMYSPATSHQPVEAPYAAQKFTPIHRQERANTKLRAL